MKSFRISNFLIVWEKSPDGEWICDGQTLPYFYKRRLNTLFSEGYLLKIGSFMFGLNYLHLPAKPSREYMRIFFDTEFKDEGLYVTEKDFRDW